MVLASHYTLCVAYLHVLKKDKWKWFGYDGFFNSILVISEQLGKVYDDDDANIVQTLLKHHNLEWNQTRDLWNMGVPLDQQLYDVDICQHHQRVWDD